MKAALKWIGSLHPNDEIDEPTADFTYARLMGAQETVKTGYKPAELDQWAKRAKTWAKKGDAFWRPLRWSVSRRWHTRARASA